MKDYGLGSGQIPSRIVQDCEDSFDCTRAAMPLACRYLLAARRGFWLRRNPHQETKVGPFGCVPTLPQSSAHHRERRSVSLFENVSLTRQFFSRGARGRQRGGAQVTDKNQGSMAETNPDASFAHQRSFRLEPVFCITVASNLRLSSPRQLLDVF